MPPSTMRAAASFNDASTIPSFSDQLEWQESAGLTPLLQVSTTPYAGRTVTYAAEEPLPINSIVSLYRCLLVRLDRYEGWMQSGTVRSGADSFWRNYTITMRFEDTPDREWLCLPVGDDNAADSWWKLGTLGKMAIKRALAALNRRTLVDWQLAYDGSDVLSDPQLAPRPLRTLSHLFNEPEGDELPNVDVRAHGALHCGTHSYCGVVMATQTERVLRYGDALTWCYGQLYSRHYAVSSACKERQSPVFGPPSRLAHATAALTRGQFVGKVAPHEFRANVAALGLATAGSSELVDELFEQWDEDASGYLDRAEVERGVRAMEAEEGHEAHLV